MFSSGTFSVNTVDTIYAAFPMLLYLNASICGPLLEPLLESQASLTGQAFAAQDLGTAYPTATGSHPVASVGVERRCLFCPDRPITVTVD